MEPAAAALTASHARAVSRVLCEEASRWGAAGPTPTRLDRLAAALGRLRLRLGPSLGVKIPDEPRADWWVKIAVGGDDVAEYRAGGWTWTAAPDAPAYRPAPTTREDDRRDLGEMRARRAMATRRYRVARRPSCGGGRPRASRPRSRARRAPRSSRAGPSDLDEDDPAGSSPHPGGLTRMGAVA